MKEPVDVARAKARAEAARRRLIGTAHILQARLAPASLAGVAWEKVRDGSELAAAKAKREIARRPVVAASVGAALAAFLIRKPLGRLIRRVRGGPQLPAPPKRTRRTRNGDDR